MDLRIAQATSLKDKRRVISHLLARCQNLHGVSASEVGAQDKYQRGEVGFAVVASSVTTAEEVITKVEDYVWSHPELEVIEARRSWMDIDS